MNTAIDGLFDFIRDFFRPDRMCFIVAAILAGVSWHHSTRFLNESSGAVLLADQIGNLLLALATILLSSLLLNLVFSPSFGTVLGETLQRSRQKNASAVGSFMRFFAICSILIGMFAATIVAWWFDWHTTTNGLGTAAYPLLDVRQAPAFFCVFGPGGMMALSSIQRKMQALSPSSRSGYSGGGGTRLP